MINYYGVEMKKKILMTGVTGVLGGAVYTGLEKMFDVYYLVRDGKDNTKDSRRV